MGTDATMIIEKGEIFSPTSVCWEPFIIEHMDRNYDLFDALRENGREGFPNTCNENTMKWIQELECWGFGWMDWNDFLKACEKCNCKKRYNLVKKSLQKDNDFIFRVIYGFDN